MRLTTPARRPALPLWIRRRGQAPRPRSDRRCHRSTLLGVAVTIVGFGLRPAPGQACVGDCSGDGKVMINDLILGVNIALGTESVSDCPAFSNESGQVDVSQLIIGVNNALNGCPPEPTTTATPTGGVATLTGACTAPGGHGGHGLKPCDADTLITVFRCDDRTACLHQQGLTMLTTTKVMSGGGWSVEVPIADASADLIFQASITDLDIFRTFALGSGGNRAPSAGIARDATTTPIEISPVTEATVQLLDSNGFENYSDTGAQQVLAAVEQATADLSFENVAPDMAVALAVQTASADPTVMMVLQTARDTPTPTATPTVTGNTPTSTPANTPAATPTRTPTNMPAATPTGTPTATPSATDTNTLTPTASLTVTATATRTVATTTTPNGSVLVTVGSVAGSSGQVVELPVTLSTGGQEVSGVQIVIGYSVGNVEVVAKQDGKPDCTVNPDIDKGDTEFAFEPFGCSGDGCSAIHATVLAAQNVTPIPDGATLFTCRMAIAPDRSGAFPIDCSDTGSSNPTGNAIPATCEPGQVAVTP